MFITNGPPLAICSLIGFPEINKNFVYKNNVLIQQLDEHLNKVGLVRVSTFWDPYLPYGDAFYINKKQISNVNLYSLNIKKFGLETLLHKKMESDRQFMRELEDEKSELLHMMYTQKKLFDRADRNKFSLKKVNIFKNHKLLSISLTILLASYIVN